VAPPPSAGPRTTAKPQTRTKAQIRKARAAAAKRAKAKVSPPSAPSSEFSVDIGEIAPGPVSSGGTGSKRELLTSPFVRVLLMSAAGLAVIVLILAALPFAALERLLAVEAHHRTEQVASFVDGHRVDIAVAGVATLLVAAAVAIPSVTG
jgi:hypothetical protein